MPTAWVVRADGGRYADHFVAGGYAGTGCLDVSSASDRDDLWHRYEQAHPEHNARQIGVQVGQIAAFLFDMREGDYVITPEADTEWLRLGQVVGPCASSPGKDGCPYQNRRPVAWAVQRLKRHDLSASLQNTLGSLLAVFEAGHVKEFLASVEKDEQIETDPDSGVEIERDDPYQHTTEHPFDPSKIKVRTIPVVVSQLISRIQHDEIDLAPEFQRAIGIWNNERKSRLIESLLLRIPIPVFYVAANKDDEWQVVDGVQRISTINDFVTGKFALNRLEYREDFNGKRHDTLPRAMRRRIDETQLVINVIEPGTPPEVMFNIFRRINTGGMPLKGQEIRHALNPGPVRDFLKLLAESNEFISATDGSVNPKRMADRECVLRFLAFHMQPWENYAVNSLDNHLTSAMRELNRMPQVRRNSLAADFRATMRAAQRIFGDDAFRKRRHPNDNRNPISMPLFEAWSVQLARCSPHQIDRLAARRDDVRNKFMVLMNDDEKFYNAISYSTGTPQRILVRFAAIRDLVQGIL